MRRFLLITAFVLLAASCGRSGWDVVDPSGTGTPTATLTPTPTPTVTATPDEVTFGDGHDGPITIATPATLNTCRAVVTGAAGSVTVELAGAPTNAFEAGRRVLVHQVQDQFATSGDTNPVAVSGSAGLWEVRRIEDATVAGTTRVLQLDLPLVSAYQTSGTGRAQACTVPEYTDVQIAAGGRIDAGAWDGTRGGVVAIYVQGTLTTTTGGEISADRAGFRGGATAGNSTQDDVTDEDTNGGDGGGKGESLERTSLGREGRGNLANGGGGGNSRNAGGGGGGNGGAGGFGGQQADTVGNNLNTRGRGGASVTYSPLARLTFGGGGGAGQEDNNQAGSGGSGGGLVLVFARRLDGYASLRANGTGRSDSVALDSFQDGAGGGGAGGSILLLSSSLTPAFTVQLSAAGGDGGDVSRMNAVDYGPGGGGSGGRIHAPGIPAAAAAVSVVGGDPGENENNDTRSATVGDAGAVTLAN